MSTSKDARDLALHFYKLKDKKITPQDMQKSVAQVKVLFNKGYTYEQVKGAINKYVDKMYSIGYLFSTIDTFIGEELLQQEKEKDLKTLPRGGKTGSNKEKYERNNNKPRFGTEHYLYLFEKSGDDK